VDSEDGAVAGSVDEGRLSTWQTVDVGQCGWIWTVETGGRPDGVVGSTEE
jgi:hypothetical protein